jgi:hypothetical protein
MIVRSCHRFGLVFLLSWAALLAFAPAAGLSRLAGQTSAAKVWLVTSSADSGPGTLRQALLDAAPGDTVRFSPALFPPSTPVTIPLASRLPAISQDGLRIDASDAGVVLDGSAAGSDMAPGLAIQAASVTVRGLHIVRFSGYGIEVRGRNHVIGGDRAAGAGPLGEGNLISANGEAGIGLFGAETTGATIQGNLIGVDRSGLAAWGNRVDGIHINSAGHNLIADNVLSGNGSGIQACCNTNSSYNTIRHNWIGVGLDGQQAIPNGGPGVWLHDGASHNTVGPGNVIAYNGSALLIQTAASIDNTITRNSIYANGMGIELAESANANLKAPELVEYDLPAGYVAGFACSLCRVELFSDQAGQGAQFEAQVQADASGYFALEVGGAFAGPYLTATATDAAGNTSPFSAPCSGALRFAPLQVGNTHPRWTLDARKSPDLADNGIGLIFHNFWDLNDPAGLVGPEIVDLGAKLVRASVNEADAALIDWSRPELVIEPGHDRFFTDCTRNGVAVMYILQFWDKAWHATGKEVPIPRFQTQAEIDRYLAYAGFIVNHFKDRVDQYELWNEPTSEGTLMTILVDDYVDLAVQTIPRIKALDPGAKVAVGSVAGMDAPHLRSFLFRLIEDDALMAMADVVSWHPFFGASPEAENYRDYYAEYPSLVQTIIQTARAHGFTGEFRADEMVYRSPDCPWCAAGDPLYSDLDAAKYYARGLVLHAGMDVGPGVAGMSSVRTPSFRTTQNLATLLAGAQAQDLSFELSTTITQVLSYTFALPDGSTLLAFWDHGPARDGYLAAKATLRLLGMAGRSADGLDVLYGYQQPLVVRNQAGDLVIQDVLVSDYPRLVRLTPARKVFLPVVP